MGCKAMKAGIVFAFVPLVRKEKMMPKLSTALIAAVVLTAMASSLSAWDHPGHMTSAAIAYAEIESQRPELIEKIGALLLAHPDPAPFWVASGDAKGNERTRLWFIEAARWPDDAKFTPVDRPNWHSARWAIVVEDAAPELEAAAAAREGELAGQAIEALRLNFGEMANPESSPKDRARALSWVLHIMGDIHQPMHVSDLFSVEYPTGHAAATMSYVADPLSDSTIPLHLLWDSNTLRTTALEDIDRNAREFRQKYPRSSFPELSPPSGLDVFREWAWESHQVAVDFAYGYGIDTVSDPNKDADQDTLIKNMVKFILEGISPVEEAPEVPAEYWEQVQETAHRRITLAGYRIADLIISAADQIAAHRNYAPAHQKY
jgi:hypothetical protein